MTILTTGFHERSMIAAAYTVSGHWDAQFIYRFDNFFHPFVPELIARLNRESLEGLLDPEWQKSLATPDPKTDPAHDFFHQIYKPANGPLVQIESFPKQIDVAAHGPYSNYNWELFFHIPLAIAVHLSKAQRFADAQRWFHFIFDPTANDQSIDPKKRFWRFLAFRDAASIIRIEDIVRILSSPRSDLQADEQLLQDQFLDGYTAIQNKPFQPHAVARTRQLAYQYCVVMKYLDNLIAWGDQLFQQDTIETINEATQIYVLAANILGQRPQRTPPLAKVNAKSFAQLRKGGLGPIGDALVELQGQISFNLAAPGSSPPPAEKAAGDALFGIGRTLYFCVPQNDKLLGYWDTVADRLFKIRHCMNIAGIIRPLALFDPPIDPGMLVKAAAAGIDIGSIVNGLNQPISPVRSWLLIQKSVELCGEVRALGNALLSAVEKGDAEHLVLVRQRHEVQIQTMTQEVKFLQWKSAEAATDSLLASRRVLLERLHYYERLLGIPPDGSNTPDIATVERPDLREETFDATFRELVGKYDKAPAPQKFPALSIAAEAGGRLYLNATEDADVNSHSPRARDTGLAASTLHALAAGFAPVPDADVDFHFWGLGGKAKLNIGTALVAAAKLGGDVLGLIASWEREQAGIASKTAAFERRADEWVLQYNLTAHELQQNGRQILGSLISEQFTGRDYVVLRQQVLNSQEVDRFLQSKFTNEDLYLWMQGEVSRLYYEYYRFAFDTARKAERTMKRELMRPELDSQDFVKFNYWDGGRKGLLSGEALHLDVKRMEMAYLEHNRRELELTKHVSLRQLNPVALLALRANGSCQVAIPEWLFDLDGPGHYMRRIKHVAASIPSVTGPYTSVSCTLSLLNSTVRKSSQLKDGEYARQGAEDDRFVDYTGAVQTMVTSSGRNDDGMFEANLRDDRLLPFEGSGVVGKWKIDLPSSYPAFDYATIADVVLHFRFTARQGVEPSKVTAALDELFQSVSQSNLALVFSLRYEFSTEWAKFAAGAGDFTATVGRNRFPYFTLGKEIKIEGIELYSADPSKHHPFGNAAAWDASSDDLADNGEFALAIPPDAPGAGQVMVRNADLEVFVVVRYSLG